MSDESLNSRIASLEQQVGNAFGMLQAVASKVGAGQAFGKSSTRQSHVREVANGSFTESLRDLPFDFLSRLVIFDDFVQGAEGLSGLAPTVSSGAISSVTVDANDRIGILEGSTGSSSSGTAALASHVGMVRLGASVWYGRADIRIPVLSTSGERFELRAGFADSASGAPTNGVYFEYSDNLSSGNWRMITNDNGTSTVTDSGIPVVAGDWYALECEIDSSGTRANFWINGVHQTVIDLTIPIDAGKEVGFVPLLLTKSVGTTAVTTEIDLCLCIGRLINPDPVRSIGARGSLGFGSVGAVGP